MNRAFIIAELVLTFGAVLLVALVDLYLTRRSLARDRAARAATESARAEGRTGHSEREHQADDGARKTVE